MNPQNSSRVTTPPSAPLAARSFSKAKTIARRLGVCPRTICRWADQGRITRHKINARVVLFDEQTSRRCCAKRESNCGRHETLNQGAIMNTAQPIEACAAVAIEQPRYDSP